MNNGIRVAIFVSVSLLLLVSSVSLIFLLDYSDDDDSSETTAFDDALRMAARREANRWDSESILVGIVSHEGYFQTNWYSIPDWFNTTEDTTPNGRCLYWSYIFNSIALNDSRSISVSRDGHILNVSDEVIMHFMADEIQDFDVDSTEAFEIGLEDVCFGNFVRIEKDFSIDYSYFISEESPCWRIYFHSKNRYDQGGLMIVNCTNRRVEDSTSRDQPDMTLSNATEIEDGIYVVTVLSSSPRMNPIYFNCSLKSMRGVACDNWFLETPHTRINYTDANNNDLLDAGDYFTIDANGLHGVTFWLGWKPNWSVVEMRIVKF